MTSTVPLKHGDVLVPLKGTAWDHNQWRELEVVSIAVVKGVTQHWVKMTDAHGFTTMDTLNLGTLRKGWTRKEKFFKIGATYQFANLNKFIVGDTYRVIEIYHIDDPMTSGHAQSAFAIAKDGLTGKQYGTSLTLSDFERMEKM